MPLPVRRFLLGLLGVQPLVAHFFVFYYGVLADITPPVALAAYAGASMAGADPFRTGNTAFRLGLGKALVPFVFVYGPAMLVVTPEFTWPDFLFVTAGAVVGIMFLSAAFAGYGLTTMRELESRRGIAYGLESAAVVALHDGDPTAALVLLGAASALRRRARTALDPGEQREIDALTASAGEAADAAWQSGEALDGDQSVALALRHLGATGGGPVA